MLIEKFSLALLMSAAYKKNTSAVAQELGCNQSTAWRHLERISLDSAELVPTIKRFFGGRNLIFVIDDLVVSKRYSQEIEGTSSMVDSSTKTFTNGIAIVAGGLTDGRYFLPIDFEQWVAEFILGKLYKSKITLAQQIIDKVFSFGLNIGHVVLDGLYFSDALVKWFNSRKIRFVIKAKTTTAVVFDGKKRQLQNIDQLRLNSNQSQKTIEAGWHGEQCVFVAVQRTGKHGPTIIYLIANFRSKAKKYRKIYDARWAIEKFIRTGKQFLGLKDSSAREAKMYLRHIRCVFLAYIFLQFIMKKFRLSSAEDALRKVQDWKRQLTFDQINDRISLLVSHA